MTSTAAPRSPTPDAVPAAFRPSRVLLVAAHPEGVTRLGAALRDAGFEVTVETDGVAACATLQSDALEALVIDLNLPGIGGMDVLHRARQADATLPIVVLGTEGDVAHRVHAIELGADDYLTQPASTEELVGRLRARLQRRRAETAQLLRAGRLEIDLRNHAVRAAGEPIALTGREFALLKLLVEAGGRTVPRPLLQERLGEWGERPASNAVDVHVHRIRRKVGRDNIYTYRGGYAIAA